MRVNEIRRNKVGATNSKANHANKQTFSALPYMSKKTSKAIAIGNILYPVVEFFNKLNPGKLFKKSEKWNHDWVGFLKDLNP